MCSSGTSTLLSNAITWVLILGGWIVIHRLTLNRDRRKEKREIADKVIEKLQKMESLAIDFHTSSIFDTLKAEEIRLTIDRLIRSIQRVPLNECCIPNSYLVCLRQAITRNNFDVSNFQTQPMGSENLRNIRVAVDDLIIQLELGKSRYWV